MSVKSAVEWAFNTEFATLEFPDTREPEERGTGFGKEWMMIERANLGGVQIDTSKGRSHPAADAELIAGIISKLPRELGGMGMALFLYAMARAEMSPDYLPEVVPKITAKAWKNPNRYGRFAKEEVCGVYIEKVRRRGRKRPEKIKREIRFCPCTWEPHPDVIRNARREYVAWWRALSYVKSKLEASDLESLKLIDELPPIRPWVPIRS